MGFTPYAVSAELKQWLSGSDNISDAVLSSVCTAVTQWIDDYTQRHFWQDGATGSEVTRTFEACHGYRLDIDDLVSLTAFKTDEAGDGTYETTWSASDYLLLPVNRPTGHPYQSVEAIAGRLFPIRWGWNGRPDRVQITGIWGWPAVPPAVKQACLIQASRVLKRKDSPEGVSGFDQFGVIRVSGRLDADVQHLLDPYRRYAVLVA